MLRSLTAFAFFLLPLPALAQFDVSSVTDPIRPDRAPLAEAEEVPAVLRLGLAGPSPLFVNPARAARAPDRFVYGTIRQPGIAAPVSFTGLFGTRDRRWLVTAENQVLTREDTESQTEARTFHDPLENLTGELENARTFERSNTFASTRARVLLIGRTDFGGYAFGLFGGYRTNNNEITLEDQFSSELIHRDSSETLTVTQRQVRSDRQVSDRDDVGIGVEVAFAGRTWDLAGSVSYQRRNAEASLSSVFESDRDSDRAIPGEREVARTRDMRSTERAIDGTPSAIDFEVVAALRAGVSRDDYLFGSVSGTFGQGTADYGLTFSEERFFVREINGEVIFEDTQSNAIDDAGEVELSTQATRASLGYVYARTPGRKRRGWTGRDVTGMTILAGINPRGGFERTEAAVAESEDGLLTSRRESEETTLALELPLYVRFGVTERLDAFGGGTYAYGYTHLETVTQPLLREDSIPEGQRVEITRERTTDTFASESRLYAGAIFTFRSGFTAQASFRGNLADTAVHSDARSYGLV